MLRALILSLLLPTAAMAGTRCPEAAAAVDSTGPFGAAVLQLETSQWENPDGGMHTCVNAAWTAADGTMLRQPLVVTTLPGKVKLHREGDDIVLVHPGGAEDTPGTTYTVRFTFHDGAQRFLAGEAEKSDPWMTSMATLDARLAAGDLLGARAAVATMEPTSAESRAEVQWHWVRGACALAEAMEKEGRLETAGIVAMSSLAHPPMQPPRAVPKGHLVFPASALAPGGHGDWVLPADDATVAALDGCAAGLMAGGYEEAALALSKIVVSFEPRHVAAQVRVGDALWSSGREEEARGHYHAAMSLAGADTPERVAQRAGVFEQEPLPEEPVEVEAAPSSYIDAEESVEVDDLP